MSQWQTLLAAVRQWRDADNTIGNVLADYMDPLMQLPPAAPCMELDEVCIAFSDRGLDDPDLWDAIYRVAGVQPLSKRQTAERLLASGRSVGKTAKLADMDRRDVLRIRRAMVMRSAVAG